MLARLTAIDVIAACVISVCAAGVSSRSPLFAFIMAIVGSGIYACLTRGDEPSEIA